MSGLYNVLFGQHSNTEQLLALLGVNPYQIPRFRSCYWDGNYIVIHTRTGGGNRDYYENLESCQSNYPEYFKNVEESQKPAGPWNDDLRKISGYSHDQDDDFDSTYADFFYTPPVAALEALKDRPADITPAEQWQLLFKAMDEMKPK